MKTEFSRRSFIKAASLSSIAAAGASSLVYAGNSPEKADDGPPGFLGNQFNPATGVAGLLFSQIGYEAGYPVRIMVRVPEKELISAKSVCKLIPVKARKSYQTNCSYWGVLWGSHWFIAEFKDIDEMGEWAVEINDNGKTVFRDKGFRVGKNILWDATVELVAADMLERRSLFTKVGAGWQDAGTLWVESCAQSAMIIGLEDLLEKSNGRLSASLTERIYKQITVGVDYLVMTQKKAFQLGFPQGAMSHDLLGHEKDILPQDAVKAVIALTRATQLLPEKYNSKKNEYTDTAELAWQWLTHTARPMGSYGMSLFQRGLPEDTKIPVDEWQTRDLILFCWAAFVRYRAKTEGAKGQCIQYARLIMDRQISNEKNENGYYGHFYEFLSMRHSEKSWTHGIVKNQFGADMGGIYPNYLMPLIDLLREWPDHEDAAKWKLTLQNFTDGFLIPVCNKNPFQLVAQGIFGNEGPVWFCGTFHGTNTVYGFTAALAFELALILNRPELKQIAYANLQWIAGLNCGITKEALHACVVYSRDMQEGIALPASMMYGVGNRWAGTWFGTRGVICNGFKTGKQFVYDIEPKKANDGPFSLTDEDWIPHSAAWLTGLVRLPVL